MPLLRFSRNTLLIGLALGSSSQSIADNTIIRPDSHSPIGVMGDHAHKAGEWMLSYRFMNMSMEGSMKGNKELSQQDVYNAGFKVAPLKMDMKMHMLGMMYAPSDNVTIMAMLPMLEKSMDAQVSPTAPAMMKPNKQFRTESAGIGDAKLGILLPLGEQRHIIAGLMLSIPTGNINQKDEMSTPMMGEKHLPYPMQLGSGSYELRPSVTVSHIKDQFSYGYQAKAVLPLVKNENGYTLGNQYLAGIWAAKPVHDNISVSARLEHKTWDNIRGKDKKIPSNMLIGAGMSPAVRTDLRAGQRTNFSLGVNAIAFSNHTQTHRLGLEYAQPIAQNLKGPQMKAKSHLTFGYQVSF